MATQRLYLYEKNNEAKKLGNSMSTSYKFDGQELTVYWKGKMKSTKANKGEAFVIKCNGGIPEIAKLKLPKNNHKLLMWLCSFYSENSATTLEQFESVIEKKRSEFSWWNYHEYCAEKMGEYSMVLCNRPDCGGEHHVAAYIDGRLPLTGEKVTEILNAYYEIRWSYIPVAFVKAVLKRRFQMNDLDLEKIHFIE